MADTEPNLHQMSWLLYFDLLDNNMHAHIIMITFTKLAKLGIFHSLRDQLMFVTIQTLKIAGKRK